MGSQLLKSSKSDEILYSYRYLYMIAQAETYIYRETGDIPVQHSFPIDIGGFSSLTCTISITIKPRSFWKTVVQHLKQGDQFVYIHVLLFNYFYGKKK